jgi:hypothetical protein
MVLWLTVPLRLGGIFDMAHVAGTDFSHISDVLIFTFREWMALMGVVCDSEGSFLACA